MKNYPYPNFTKTIFKLVHRKFFKQTVETNSGTIPYYSDIIEIKGWRTVLIDNYSGQRSTVTIMYWFDGIFDKRLRDLMRNAKLNNK